MTTGERISILTYAVQRFEKSQRKASDYLELSVDIVRTTRNADGLNWAQVADAIDIGLDKG